jgi:hypothetical protein|tara:strand:+ start:1361 stop:3193 length:1833 start_codon:yes stop_codon:yes gene_type:complete
MDLKSSDVGQLAGSILSRRNKDYKDRAKKGIAFSLFANFIDEAKKGLRQGKEDAIEDLATQYNPIFERNKEVYNNPINASNRQNYQLYIQNPKEYLHNAAVVKFNSDPDLVRELGANPWNKVTKENLDDDDYNTAISIYKAFQNDEKLNIENLGTQPFISNFTLTDYNQTATDAYNAAVDLIKDDPTKKNIVKQLWNKTFKTRRVREGNIERLQKRFPKAFEGRDIEIGDVISVNTDLIDLTNNLKAKKDLEIAQLNSETLLTTPENKEQTEISSTIEQNDEVNKTTIATYGSSNVERTYNFTTKVDTLKLNKQNFVTKVNKVGYEITEADIGKAIEYNVTIPGFPGLRNIAPSNRTDLLTAIQKINTNPDFRPLSSEVGLNPSEIRAYALVLNQNPDAMVNNELKLRQTQAEMNKVINIDPEDVDSYFSNKQIKQRVTSSILSYMSDNINDNTFNYEGNLSGIEQNGFVYNVIEGALQLQGINKNLSFDDAIIQALPIQTTGIYKFKDKPFYKTAKRADLYRTEFVNMEVIDFMENKTLNDARDAKTAVEYLNTKKYIQNRVVNKKTGETLIPAENKEFSQDGFRFFTINVGNEAAPLYRWTFEKLPTQ